jgi:hypothetical protein
VLFERNALQTALKNYDDEVVREASASIFYAYLRRLHEYATRRNENAGELVRAPFGGRISGNAHRSFWSRAWGKIAGRKPLVSIDDPLTAMQFRALEWIVRNEARIAAKRAAVQATRKRPDAEIFEKFPLHFVPTYPGDDQLFRGELFRMLRPRLRSVDRTLSDIIAT